MVVASAGLVPVEASTTQLANQGKMAASARLAPVEASTIRLAAIVRLAE